ncbi:succinyl-diaminopimelate desuccinylase [Litorivicinus sp.]|nr:succinyl-diaminopimelate desuccinylase [Litorivicinus sp.]
MMNYMPITESHMDCPVRKLAEELIRRESVTPEDKGCITLIGDRLEAQGFQLERMDQNGVTNLWATLGEKGPTFCFAGHTDVVPVGDPGAWSSHPFEPTVTNSGYLRGRGAADMKSSLAAMVVAVEDFIESHQKPNGRIAFLLTSDEEGPATDGTVAVVEELKRRQTRQQHPEIDYCIVGEPSSKNQLGDVVRIGRRGSLNAEITVHGTQGHVAYPELVENPIHRMSTLITKLVEMTWDESPNSIFPPTSFQVSNVKGGSGATNVVPGTTSFLCNWRFSTSTDAQKIQKTTEHLLNILGFTASIEWTLSGQPFLTEQGRLTKATIEVIKEETAINAELSTGGGTSDGRFIAKLGCQLIELGPVNRSIHKIDEEVLLSDLPVLKALYQGLLEKLLT